MAKEKSCRHESCQVRLDFTNMMTSAIGDEGFSPQLLWSCHGKAEEAHQRMKLMRQRGQLAWMELPNQKEMVREIVEYRTMVEGQFTDLVILGIGGAAVGTLALKTALSHPLVDLLPQKKRGKAMRVFVADNIDPERFSAIFDVIDPKKTLFNVVSKSGTTAETLAQFMIVFDLLKKKLGVSRLKKHLVFTTDPKIGILRKIADAGGYKSFEIPPAIGSRYSVMSRVCLLPAALMGIDIEAFLDGAARMDVRLQEPDFMKNPAYLSAIFQYLADTRYGRNMVVMMPYVHRLRDVADWYRQLWAESLGKRETRDGEVVNCGSTPINSMGVKDQHSQVQLYVEGPQDKVVVFLAVAKYREAAPIPKFKPSIHSELSFLEGKSLEELIQNERITTAMALKKARRPNMTYILPEVNPCTIGQLMYLLEVQTAFAGELYNINAFDQPGLDAGKKATNALMGKRGLEKLRKEMEADFQESAVFEC